ncbi:MAG: hypothetical protein ACTSRZ_02355 [Promethearchaeota archaeon]
MPNYDPVEYWLYLPKAVEIFCFFITGLIIYKKKKYIVNKLFAIAMWCWNIYTISDLIIWTHGADSITMLKVVNVVRDIQIIAAISFAFLIYFATQVIDQSLKALNKRKIIIIGIIFYALGVIMCLNESIFIQDPDGNILNPSEWETAPLVIVATDINLFFGSLMLLPVILYILSIQSLNRVKKKIEDPISRKRMNRLILGIALLPTGLIYFAIILGLGIVTNTIIWFTIGRAIWIVCALLILSSQSFLGLKAS